jgi:hypothetical protein
MTKLILFAFVCFDTLANGQLGPIQHPQALDDSVFQSCDDVLSRALEISSKIREPAYVMELFPRTQGRVGPPFPSEVTAAYAARWVANYDLKAHPYALFYFAGGSYTMRCRDNGGRYVKRSGPSGVSGPLDLKLAAGKAEIWHFYFTPINNAHVFVLADIPLSPLDGEGLMAKVKELLSARHINLYVRRNDPWFLGVAPDALPYLFTDHFNKITLPEYQATPTMSCETVYGCKVGPSSY